MSYPLEGVKVLDMSRVLAGPFAGRMLSDLGADVVKVEPPEGDVTRIWGAQINGIAGYFHQQNVGKRGVSVDLRLDDGVDVVRELAQQADVLLENFRSGVMQRLGLGYESLAASNPGLVMLSISGFGADSPESARGAYAPIIHAESGLVSRQAQVSGSAPKDIAVSLADTNASLHGMVGLLSALLMRTHTGTGQHIDLAMIDATLATDDHLHYALEASADTGPLRSETWETGIGPIMIAGDIRYLYKRLVEVFGLTDPTPEGATLEEKIQARRTAVIEYLRALPDHAAVEGTMKKMNLAWGRVRESVAIHEQPTVAHRGTLTDVDDRAGGRRPVVQSPYRFSAADSGVRAGAPHQGEHNRDVLKEWLGFDDARIDGLTSTGALLSRRR